MVTSSSSVSSGIESCIVFINACTISHEFGVSSCRRLSMRSGGRTAAFRTGRGVSGSGIRSLIESSGVEFVLMRAVRDGVAIASVVRVYWRSSTFSWIGIAVVSRPVKAMHLMGPSSVKVGPLVWWKKDDLISLSKASMVRMTVAGVVWIEARFASFSALVVAVLKMLIIFEHSCCSCRLSSW